MIKYIKILNVIWLVLLGFFLLSCDKIEPPYTEEIGQDTVSDVVVRKILLEDYTGHTCPNCPEAAALAHELYNNYSNRLIIMTVHAGYYAAPSSAPYNTDLRCAAGNELNTFFGISAAGNPNGMINRDIFNSSKIINPDNWYAAFNIQYQENEPLIKIDIQNNYNNSERQLQTSINVKFITELAGSYKLAVYILEDSIVSAQKNNNTTYGNVPVIYDYVHRNVLRSDINGTFGVEIAQGNINSNYVVEKTYSKNLNTNWNEHQCYILAYVYEESSYKILQSEIKKIIN